MKRFTIKDIARRTGVNPSTVSRALRDHPDISLSLREEIKKLAAEMNYRPNSTAVQLRQGNSRQIGLVVPEMIMFFYPSVIRGIEEVLHAEGYHLVMLSSNETPERELENLQICIEQEMAGILLSLVRTTSVPAQLEWLLNSDMPVVLFDKILEELPFDAVTLDDQQSTTEAVKHLVKTGCKRIGGIFGNPRLLITQWRLDSFRKVLLEAGLPYGDRWVRFADNSLEAGIAVRELMSQTNAPDGIFAMSDEVLIGSMPVIGGLGLKIPDDCSIICMSDGFLPYCLYPQVTFMHHDGQEVGRMAARKLLRLITRKATPGITPEHYKLQTKLVELQTTRK